MNEFAWIIGIMIALGVAAAVGVHLYVYVSLWIAGIRLKTRLAAQGRTLSLEEAKDRIAHGEGIIVVDSPTLGWNTARVWWVPADAFVPRPDTWNGGRMCPEEDFTNHDRLIDPSTGIAKLICPFVLTQKLPSLLKQHFALETYAYIFTSGVAFERDMAKRKPQVSETGETDD